MEQHSRTALDGHAVARSLALHEARLVRRWRFLRRWMRWMPRRQSIQRYPGLKRFATRLRDLPFLWSYKGSPLIRALYLGAVITLLPLLFLHIITGALAALIFRANLPVIIALTLLSNPLTTAPILYCTYKAGKLILDVLAFDTMGTYTSIAPALTIGGIACGLVLGALLHLVATLFKRRAETKRRRIHRLRGLLQQLREQDAAAQACANYSQL